jgi:hypothetical protein
MVIPAKTLVPQKDRVNNANAVYYYGQQKAVAICKPRHMTRLPHPATPASGK